MSYKIYSNTNVGMFSNLLKGLEKIEGCCNQKQIEEAAQMGLELISRSTNPNMNLYRFEDCNHTAFLQPTHVRRGNFKCNQCLLSKLASKCLEFSSHLIFNTGGTKYKVLLKCGHFTEKYANAFDYSTGEKCKDCFDEAIKASCEKNGYILLGHEGHVYRKIRLTSCQHERVVAASQILKGNIGCRECVAKRYVDSFESQGITPLVDLPERDFKIFKLPCGCEKRMRIDHAASGNWSCNNCEDNHYTKPSYLYLLKIEHSNLSWLKLGYAKNIETRKKGYGLLESCKVSTICSMNFKTGYDAMTFEKSLHRKYKSHKLDSEFMQSYHTISGYTECYPVSMEKALLEEFQ